MGFEPTAAGPNALLRFHIRPLAIFSERPSFPYSASEGNNISIPYLRYILQYVTTIQQFGSALYFKYLGFAPRLCLVMPDNPLNYLGVSESNQLTSRYLCIFTILSLNPIIGTNKLTRQLEFPTRTPHKLYK